MSPMVNMDIEDMEVVDMDMVDIDVVCLFLIKHHTILQIPSPNGPDSRTLGFVNGSSATVAVIIHRLCPTSY